MTTTTGNMINPEHTSGISLGNLNTLISILCNIDAIILATVPETGEIIFYNDCKDFWGASGDGSGQFCYNFFHGYTERCAWCPYEQIKELPDQSIQWELYKPENNRTFQMNAMMIDWLDFGTIHLEYGIEITSNLQQRKMLESILNGMEALICVTNIKNNQILFLNDSIRNNFGIKEDGIGQICHKLLQKLDEPCPSCPYLQLQKEPDKTIIWEHHETVKNRILRKCAKLIDWPGGGKAHLEFAIDITESKNMEKDIIRLELEAEKIYYDPLTEIYSRRYFEENIVSLIDTMTETSGTLSLMMIDIDHFKRYNDTYGHIKGDDCLKEVAEILQHCLEENENFVARFGGEEFVAVLPYADIDSAQKTATKMLHDVLERKIPHANNKVSEYLTISIGVVVGNVTPEHNRETFLELADDMLYESKQGGRNRYTLTLL